MARAISWRNLVAAAAVVGLVLAAALAVHAHTSSPVIILHGDLVSKPATRVTLTAGSYDIRTTQAGCVRDGVNWYLLPSTDPNHPQMSGELGLTGTAPSPSADTWSDDFYFDLDRTQSYVLGSSAYWVLPGGDCTIDVTITRQ